MGAGHLGFEPRTNATAFKCFVTIQDGWGSFSQTGPAGLPTGTVTLAATCGTMSLARPFPSRICTRLGPTNRFIGKKSPMWLVILF